MTVTGAEWLQSFAAALGLAPPSPEETDALLALAGMAAHASERTAAPLTAWLVGRSGRGPEEARRIAADLARRLEERPDAEGVSAERGEGGENGGGENGGGENGGGENGGGENGGGENVAEGERTATG